MQFTTSTPPDSQFITLLRNHLKFANAQLELPLDESLKALGLDSMAAVDLLLDVEDGYGIAMPDAYLTEQTFATATSLWMAIQQLREGSPAV